MIRVVRLEISGGTTIESAATKAIQIAKSAWWKTQVEFLFNGKLIVVDRFASVANTVETYTAASGGSVVSCVG